MNGESSTAVHRMVRPTAAALCGCIALTVALGACWMIVDPRSEGLAVATGIAALTMLLSGAWLVALLVIGARRLRLPMRGAMIAVLGGVLLVIVSLLLEHAAYWGTGRLVSRAGLTVLLPALAFIHNGGMSLLRTRSALLVIKIMTMICAWLFAAGLLAIQWFEPALFSSWFGLLMTILLLTAITGAGAAVGTIIVPIVVIGRVDRTARRMETFTSWSSLDMACPKCGHRQAFAVGNVRCPACRTRLYIEIEEPRCECGYLLYRLEGEVCPECGRAIPPEMRWRGVAAAAGGPAGPG